MKLAKELMYNSCDTRTLCRSASKLIWADVLANGVTTNDLFSLKPSNFVQICLFALTKSHLNATWTWFRYTTSVGSNLSIQQKCPCMNCFWQCNIRRCVRGIAKWQNYDCFVYAYCVLSPCSSCAKRARDQYVQQVNAVVTKRPINCLKLANKAD